MRLSDFDYQLPEELIAQFPPVVRGQSRLLDASGELVHDRTVQALPQLLRPNDLLVFNDTRVLKARLFGRKRSGGKVEVLVERVLSEYEVLAHVRASKSPPVDSQLILADRWTATVLGRQGEFFHLRFEEEPALAVLAQSGRLPLPPYIVHTPTDDDEQRYQTVYARQDGAVAAPTAGLHFTDALLAELAAMGVGQAFVTLHVGAGTFQPVRVEDLSEHQMHSERYDIPAATVTAIEATRAKGGRVIAVGTTSLRALESAARCGTLAAGWQETDLFITPGYRFQLVDLLLTNFHLPKSTLLMLVSAFTGYERMRALYQHAITERYRFFSYGDAMLLSRDDTVTAW
ncbi:tRNA preQ1(34) S-adenosylmethionine ribosyltransferase-isomerase QueA [Leeia aquatica]|uniref:S-adenosylmethionine:tRNA ribosyltransferase-isomerase n=1 Tax=Leeia aquatica TaxID=2725557 RepID=A0A847SBW8_9NEIS|nr:tRNA preQ1(34) S-adenosylmethionine ribosyltransferase-isomerase QueA [Leeia aquatica]NLR75006.1 tRNA preQ1(34) S-adenosylmethionine ribosyltransferase-isomerase QueA [Leeia aquatica]